MTHVKCLFFLVKLGPGKLCVTRRDAILLLGCGARDVCVYLPQSAAMHVLATQLLLRDHPSVSARRLEAEV